MRTIFLILLCLLPAAGSPVARAHVPVPDSVLNPRTAPEAWNVLRLATANTARLLDENRLSEIPDQISLCSPALRALPTFAPAQRTDVKADAVRAAVTIDSLAQGSVAGDRPFVVRSLETLRANLHDLAASFDPATVNADIFVCPMHPGVVNVDPHTRCPKCGMGLLPRRIPYSFVYTAPGEPTLRLTGTTDAPLQADRLATVTIHLAHADGAPVVPADLLVVHTQPIHLLVVDAGLRDYHHEHPATTPTPGEYTFSFTPAASCSYRIFADVVPSDTAVQEYPFADLPGASPIIQTGDRTPGCDAVADGFRFHLECETGLESLRANQAQTLRVTVAAPDGRPVTTLEPVMAAFAHLVGFYADGRTVVHFHPSGAEISEPGQRGGPTLLFRFYPPSPGFLRLYCQVQISGRQVYAPFNVMVAP